MELRGADRVSLHVLSTQNRSNPPRSIPGPGGRGPACGARAMVSPERGAWRADEPRHRRRHQGHERRLAQGTARKRAVLRPRGHTPRLPKDRAGSVPLLSQSRPHANPLARSGSPAPPREVLTMVRGAGLVLVLGVFGVETVSQREAVGYSIALLGFGLYVFAPGDKLKRG